VVKFPVFFPAPASGLLTIRELGFVLRARLSAPIRDYLEFPDIILTAHDFLEGSGRANRFTVDRKERRASLAKRLTRLNGRCK
jgi:hypothetical protein